MPDPETGSTLDASTPANDEDRRDVAPTQRPSARNCLASLRRRIWANKKPALETLVALAAIVGAVTGTVAWVETRQVALSLSAETQQGYFVSPQGLLVPQDIVLTITNGSSRPVNLLSGGELLLRKRRVGRITALAAESPSDIQGGGVPAAFPYTLQAGSGSKVRLKWTPDGEAEQALRRAVQRDDSSGLGLRMRFQPGGSREVAVKAGLVSQQFFGWRTFLTLLSNRVVGIDLAAADRATGAALVTLRLWSAGTDQRRPSLVMVRPVSYDLSTNFRLPSLPTGRYLYAFTAESRTAAVGSFQTPCKGEDGRYYVTHCDDGDATRIEPLPALTD